MSGLHRFTANPPDDLFPVELVAPEGATGMILKFQVKKGPEPEPAVGLRLLHLRNAGQDHRPRTTEILELVYRNGIGVLSWHGFGPAKEGHRPPDKTGKLPAVFPVVVTLPLVQDICSVTVGDFVFHGLPELQPAHTMELLMGFTGQGDLRPPAGWEISWGEDAVEWVGATSGGPVTPPITPPSAPLPTANSKDALKADLEALILKYAAAQGIDPLALALISLAIQKVGG